MGVFRRQPRGDGVQIRLGHPQRDSWLEPREDADVVVTALGFVGRQNRRRPKVLLAKEVRDRELKARRQNPHYRVGCRIQLNGLPHNFLVRAKAPLP
jgi:hypothetical protein